MSTFAQRLLHTSRPHRLPRPSQGVLDKPPTEAYLASSYLRRSVNEPEIPEVNKFRLFQQTSPHSFTAPQLLPDQPSRPPARPPLLGPPKKIAKELDPFHILKSSPMEHTLNPEFTLSFVNNLGRIKGRAETALTWRSQRMVGKLVRRARGMGLIGRWSNQIPVGGFGSER